MAEHTPEQIKEFAKTMKDRTDEQLVLYYQIASSRGKKYLPIQTAAEKERRARGLIKTISTKPNRITSNPTADAYEAVEVIHD